MKTIFFKEYIIQKNKQNEKMQQTWGEVLRKYNHADMKDDTNRCAFIRDGT